MARVWSRLGLAYGHRFTGQFGEQPSSVWIDEISTLPMRQIAEAIGKLRDAFPEWPPNAYEFRALVLGPSGNAEQRARDAQIAIEEQRRENRALPGPEALAAQTTTGRQWLGYWYRRGIKPTPAGVTAEDIDAMLAGADIEAMDRQTQEASQ